ncbi:hypothetical protein UlMin_037672 [Ulmus minor]
MTRLRKKVATCLKDFQNTFAMLTTFNEKLRSNYKDTFVEKHGVKLGLMSGYMKVSAISVLHYQIIVNVVIDGNNIIYRDYIDIRIAIRTPKGLVVPVLRNAGGMNFAEIEKEINTLAKTTTEGSIIAYYVTNNWELLCHTIINIYYSHCFKLKRPEIALKQNVTLKTTLKKY